MSAQTQDPDATTAQPGDAAAGTSPEGAAVEPAAGAPAGVPAGRGRAPWSPRRRLAVAGAGGLAVVALLWGGAAVATSQHLFAGSSVSGIDVAGMSPDEAEAAVSEGVGATLAEAVTIRVGSAEDQLVPAESGVTVDAAASVRRLTGFTLNPAEIVRRLGGERTTAVTRVDAEKLRSALASHLDTLATGASSASVTLDGTTPVITPATFGTGLDLASSVTSLSRSWPLGRSTIELASGKAAPAITDADAQVFIDSTLTPLLGSDLTVTATGTKAESAAKGADLTLTPEQTASLTRISSDGGRLTASIDAEALHKAVLKTMGTGVEKAATDASWTISGDPASATTAKPEYVKPASGLAIDTKTLAADVLKAGTSGRSEVERTVTLPITVDEPAVTTPADEWGMTQVIGEYRTPYYPDAARTQNLVAGTAAINGTVVMAGQTFSLTDALGAIDAEHGFTESGVVTDGVHSNAMGGGLSQVATTTFNAAFEAGMDDVEHHPHNYWFERYPAGREATLWTGVLDVKFRNSTPRAVMVQAWASDGYVNVRLWGTPYYTVSIDNGTPTGYRAYQTVHKSGSQCEPYAGGTRGFDITVTRSRTKPDGTKMPDDVLTTSYDSDNPVVCD